MTGTEKIKSKILEDAEARASQIEEQARQEAQGIVDKALEEAELKRTEILQKAEEDGKEAYRRMLSVAGLEGRKEILKAKQDMVETAFKTAMDKLCQLPDSEYQKLLEDIAINVAKSENGEILLSEKDRKRLDKDFIKNVNRGLASDGKKGELVLSKDNIKTSGGFILRYGEMEINSTFEILFEMQKPGLENDVVNILFPNP